MEEIKRLIVPVVAAVILHGFLFSFNLPKQQTFKPALKGIPIKLEINSVAQKKVLLPQPNVENKKEEIIPKIDPPKKAVPKEIIEPQAVTPQPQKKAIIKPELTKKVVRVEEKNKKIDLQTRPVKIQEETPAKEVVNKSLVKRATASVQVENIEKEPEKILPEKEAFIAPIQKKAIPIYQQNKRAPYPVMAKRRGYEGEVLLSVLVNAEGKVSELKIKRSSGHVSLDRAAAKAVKTWLFSPAKEGDKSVSMWVDVPYGFELQ